MTTRKPAPGQLSLLSPREQFAEVLDAHSRRIAALSEPNRTRFARVSREVEELRDVLESGVGAAEKILPHLMAARIRQIPDISRSPDVSPEVAMRMLILRNELSGVADNIKESSRRAAPRTSLSLSDPRPYDPTVRRICDLPTPRRGHKHRPSSDHPSRG